MLRRGLMKVQKFIAKVQAIFDNNFINFENMRNKGKELMV